MNQPPRDGERQRALKSWLQVGTPKPLPNSRWGCFGAGAVQCLCFVLPTQPQLHLAEPQDSLGGWVCDLDTKASAGIGLPKEDSLSPDLQLCSVLLASLLFQIQQFPNARTFGDVGTAPSLWLCPSAGEAP